MMPDREVEGALAVVSEAPNAVLRELKRLRSIGRYLLRPQPEQHLHDVYLDTEDGALESMKVALRLRDRDGASLLAVKADQESVDLVSDRLEIESAWSQESLGRALAELQTRGISVRNSAVDADAMSVLRKSGLKPIQIRDTVRHPRDAMQEQRPGDPVAEIAIDSVTYRFPEGQVQWHEVEAEARGQGDATVVSEILSKVVEAFAGDLRVWRYPKIATGLALGRLQTTGRLAGLLTEGGVLSPLGYALLESILGDEAHSAGV
jgi:inorganic triphosphatase YgiF